MIHIQKCSIQAFKVKTIEGGYNFMGWAIKGKTRKRLINAPFIESGVLLYLRRVETAAVIVVVVVMLLEKS